MKNAFLLFIVFSAASCGRERVSVKEIDTGEVKLVLKQASAPEHKESGYITITIDGETDTICVADNIAGMELKDRDIEIGFYGSPSLNGRSVTLPHEVFGYAVHVDITGKR
jgi:hypothetical protein